MLLSSSFIYKFTQTAKSPDPDLAPAALLIARLEYTQLDSSRYLQRLDKMGSAATKRLSLLGAGSDPIKRIEVLNRYLFKEEGFTKDLDAHEDPRNSFLNEVLDRRTGIPIALALIYIEVARRAGFRVDGIDFPGHFLLRLPQRTGASSELDADLIMDPFHGGVLLSETDCHGLLLEHVGNDATFDRRLLIRATKQQILIRILLNLKHIYVRMRSFQHARAVTELLLALDPSAMAELRDRGLLAYHLNDFPAALRDLEAYLRFTSHRESQNKKGTGEHAEIWEHVKALRRRVASLN